MKNHYANVMKSVKMTLNNRQRKTERQKKQFSRRIGRKYRLR